MPTALQSLVKGWKCLFGSTARGVGKNSRDVHQHSLINKLSGIKNPNFTL